MVLDWQTSLSELSGVGSATLQLLRKLNLSTVGDLILNFPRKYEDYSNVVKISNLKPGRVSLKAKIKQISGRYMRGGLHITEAIASDDSGSVRIVWFNQPYRINSITPSQNYFISGNYEFNYGRMSIISPGVELESSFPINTARILPIYRETKGLNSRQIRKFVKICLKNLPKIDETLPKNIITKQALMNRNQAIVSKHFPESATDLARADERVGFEELFELILSSQVAKNELNKNSGIKIEFNQQLTKQFVSKLPFKLTDSQRQVVWQIFQDLESGFVMNRLLEGDVGTGKTVVAVMTALMVLKSKKQVALMVPTELLARQHADSISKLLASVDLAENVILLVGSLNKSQKNKAEDAIASGKPLFIIGTHSLIQEKIDLSNLALIVVDEQHRFGVSQRQKLLTRGGKMPHMLSMTATPIPRSLALTIFGELEISILSDKPCHQLPVETSLIHPNDRARIYDEVEVQLLAGRQAFVVCPIIEDSETINAKSVNQTYNELTKRFKKFKVNLLHGKQHNLDNQAIMQDFIKGKVNILVATTMIEVGVDVHNATVMMIESPERFGLAQLHQLRGRIGRGDKQGFCYLMLNNNSGANSRLRALQSTNDGFKLAELDLKIRGAGALYGTLQHGALDLKIADFTDAKLIARARKCALDFLKDSNNLLQYPNIEQRILELQSVVHLN